MVPARHGSQGLPLKNMRLLGGKPLVAWTLDCALQWKYDKILLTSDWDEVLDLGRSYKDPRIIPVKRPASLSENAVPLKDIFASGMTMACLDPLEFETTHILNPTSPLREPVDIEMTYQSLVALAGKFTSCSVTTSTLLYVVRSGLKGRVGRKARPPHDPRDVYRPKIKVNDDNPTAIIPIRQHRRPDIVQNGAVYCMKSDFFMESGRHVSFKMGVHFMPQWRSIDIDTIWDLLAAESWLPELARRRGEAS